MTEQQRIYLEERWQTFIDRNACASGEEVSWDDCIHYVDEALEELAVRLNLDPAHGVYWQQRMALMMFRKQEIIILKHKEESNDANNQRLARRGH